MSRRGAYVLAGMLAASVVLMPVSLAWAQDLASPIEPLTGVTALPQDVKAAWGCVLVGTAGTAAALSANSVNLLNVVAGGIVTPVNPTVLYLGLAGVVFTSFCTLGQQLTPLYIYYFQKEPEPRVEVAKPKPPHSGGIPRLAWLDAEDVAYPWQSAK